ncbi:UNVERIFIED_CONTAM: hypothetical protein HDU68_008152 [Siphonaria sp. JEL0065]|nr:hypothetical protein HDU68_008152 [Siphonaria sp. JEL0065]
MVSYAKERDKIKGHLETTLACLRVIEKDPETGVKIVGIATPIVTCVTGMLREVELVEAHGQHRDDNGGDENESPDVEDVVIGMKIVSIGEESEVSPIRDAKLDPWCFLGLLGVDVLSGLSWKAPYEAHYKKFWRKVRKGDESVF